MHSAQTERQRAKKARPCAGRQTLKRTAEEHATERLESGGGPPPPFFFFKSIRAAHAEYRAPAGQRSAPMVRDSWSPRSPGLEDVIRF